MDRMSLVPGPMVEREDGREVRRDKPGTESRTVDRFTLEKRIEKKNREGLRPQTLMLDLRGSEQRSTEDESNLESRPHCAVILW